MILTIQNRCLGAQRDPAGKCDDKACPLRLFDWHAPRRSMESILHSHLHSPPSENPCCRGFRCCIGQTAVGNRRDLPSSGDVIVVRNRWISCAENGSSVHCGGGVDVHVFSMDGNEQNQSHAFASIVAESKGVLVMDARSLLDIFQEVTLNTFRVWN